MGTILLTGANGSTGKAVLSALASRGAQVRVFIRDLNQANALSKLGAADYALGDLLDPESITTAMVGCSKVLHICPPMHPDEAGIGRRIVDIAKQNKIAHFIEYSVLHPLLKEVRHHQAKLEVETHLIGSGLPFTILQPCRYMQHLLKVWQKVRETGVNAVPYSIDVRLSVVDLKDLAEAVSTVVTTDGHIGATYEFAGPESLSEREMASIISEVLGQPVRAEEKPLDVWQNEAQANGMNPNRIETMTLMFRHYTKHGLIGNGNVLGFLLGRPPTTFRQFVKRLATEDDSR